MVPVDIWVRVPMTSPTQKACFKICKCNNKGLTSCQPLPCVTLENCRLHDKVVQNGKSLNSNYFLNLLVLYSNMKTSSLPGEKYYMECNACSCVLGERVCSRRACGKTALLTGLPCNCPPHHLPVHTPRGLFPNACLAK